MPKIKNKRPCLAVITSRLIGLEYELGKVDCFSIIIVYLRAMKVKLPSEFEGLTLDTYAELFKKDPDNAIATMLNCLDSISQPVPPHKAQPGDILLLKLRSVGSRQQFISPGINAGNGHVIVAMKNQGVVMVPLRYYTRLRGWKCC